MEPKHIKGAKISNTSCAWRLHKKPVPYIHIVGFDYLK